MHKYVRKLIALALVAAMLLSLATVASAAEAAVRDSYPTYAEAYNIMTGLRNTYPEGMTWTNYEPYGNNGLEKHYTFQGGSVKGARLGVGCAAFCFLLSDKVFGSTPARVLDRGSFRYEDIKVSDFLRVNNSHFVTVLRITSSGIVVAEGNYNSSVHWGRAISRDEIMESANFLVTRYPAGYTDPDESNVDEIVASGTEGSLNWTITRGGLLSISGSGVMNDYDNQKRPSWESATDDSGASAPFYTVDIGSGVNSIGNYAFYGSNIVGISIPPNVKTVGDSAFRSCVNLTSVTLSDGIQTIDQNAFRACTSLAYIDIPGSVTSIGSGAFFDCTNNLRQVRFMPSKTSINIGSDLFYNCWNLNFISLPEGIAKIPAGLFGSCKTIQYLYLPGTLTEIAEAGQIDPFMSSGGVSTIYFGGTESQWKALVNAIPQSLPSAIKAMNGATVYYEQTDPFVPAVDDPGDIHFCENDVHVGPIENGICQNCGEAATESVHHWSADWDHDETYHWHNCTDANCTITSNSQKDGYDAHTFGSWVIDTAATSSQAGSRHRDCTFCGYRQTESIPATGSSSSSGESGGSSSSSGSITTSTTKNEDGSITTRTENKITGTVTETTRNTDGSQTVVETKKDGTVTTTKIDAAGSKTATVANPDGSSMTTVAQKDGTTATVATSAEGKTKAEVKLSAQAVAAAQEHGGSIVLPIPAVTASKTIEMAPVVTVTTGSKTPVKVGIPVVEPASGIVAMLVKEDNTEVIIKTSIVTEDGVVVALPDGAVVKLVDNSKDFEDVFDAYWGSDAVDFVSARGLFSGTNETTFAPEAPMTRAMLMTVLARFDGEDTNGGETWYEKGRDWAVANGISDGTNLNGNITREQVVTMLWRYLGSPSSKNNLSEYTDVRQISSYAQEAMWWAVENGIVSGFGNSLLRPQGQATRAQVAQVLRNFIVYISFAPEYAYGLYGDGVLI